MAQPQFRTAFGGARPAAAQPAVQPAPHQHAARAPGAADAAMREFEASKAEYARLRDMKVRNEADVERLRGEVAAAEEEALNAFGTSDPAALRAEAARIEAEWAARAAEFRLALKAIGGQVETITAAV